MLLLLLLLLPLKKKTNVSRSGSNEPIRSAFTGFYRVVSFDFSTKEFYVFFVVVVVFVKNKKPNNETMAVAPFFVPSFNSFFFWGTGGFIWFFIFFLGYGDGWRPTWRRLKKKKMAADFLPSLKKKIMATATFRSGTIRSIGRSNQSGNSIEKKLALKSRVTACKSAKKREKNYWTTTTKKKEAHAVTVKLRQLRTTWRTSGPFELVRQRQRWFFFLYFFEISFFFLFWNVWSWFVLFVAVAGRKKKVSALQFFLLLLFSRPSPFILFDFFYFFFGCT